METSAANRGAIVRTLTVVALLATMAWIAKRFLLDGGDPMPPRPAPVAGQSEPAGAAAPPAPGAAVP